VEKPRLNWSARARRLGARPGGLGFSISLS